MIKYYYEGVEVEYLYRVKGSDCRIVLDGEEIDVPKKALQKRSVQDPNKRRENFEKRFGNEGRVQRIKMHPCLICGRLPSDNAHVRSRSLGGVWQDIVPLCRQHHDKLDRELGLVAFNKKYNVDLETAATKFVIEYPVQ